MNWNIQRW